MTNPILEQRKAILFFSLLLLLYTFAPRYVGMGHASRYDLTLAVADDHTFNIDKYVHNTIDWSFYNGHYYTNKAPGVSLLAVPFYFLLTRTEKFLNIDTTHWGYRNLRWTDVCVTALPSVLLCILFFIYLSRLSIRGSHPWIVVFAYAVASNAFTFSTMLWAHQTAAAFLFASFFFLVSEKKPFWMGFFLGLAILTEYSTALALPAYFLYLVTKSEANAAPIRNSQRARNIILAAVGGLPWFILFCFYHKVCFGGFLHLANRYGNPVFVEQEKIFGVLGIPSFSAFYKLLIGIHRGVFMISPILALSLLGFVRWLKEYKYRAEGLISLWIVLGFLLFNSSFNAWHAGCTSGPRYLVPMLPFLAVPLIWVKPGKFFYFALFISAINVAAIAAVDTTVCIELRLLDEGIYPHIFGAAQRWRQLFPIGFTVIALFFISRWKAKLS